MLSTYVPHTCCLLAPPLEAVVPHHGHSSKFEAAPLFAHIVSHAYCWLAHLLEAVGTHHGDVGI